MEGKMDLLRKVKNTRIGKFLKKWIYKPLLKAIHKDKKSITDLSGLRWKENISQDEWKNYIVSILDQSRQKNNLILFNIEKAPQDLKKYLWEFIRNNPRINFYCGDINYRGKALRELNYKNLNGINAENSLIINLSQSNRDISSTLSQIVNDETLKTIPYIFKVVTGIIYPIMNKYDKRKNSIFVSPVFEEEIINNIYQESLALFEQKCDVRDALDFYQMLKQIEIIEGDIVEFGSFRGHSGWIISKLVEELNYNKKVYLCDTFEEFPFEYLGVDNFWNNTHGVDFDDVKKKFTGFDFVNFIKGDFSDTIEIIPAEKFSFVYIDCDSYRAVELITEKIYPKLSSGGIIIFEDYGHDFCLGARVATERFLAKKKDCIKFFSGFSGLQIFVKK